MNNPDNYSGITFLNFIGKLFTAVLNDGLANFIVAIGTIGDEQAGFGYGFYTVDHIFTLHAIIQIYLNKKQK